MISRVKECLPGFGPSIVARHYRPLSSVRYVVIHKTSLSQKGPDNPNPIGDSELNVVNMTASFRVNTALGTGGWAPYHVLIGADGLAEQGLPLELYGAHARQWNRPSIAIAVVGDFDRNMPTADQWESLVACVSEIVPINGGLEIVGHTDLPNSSRDLSKTCPGKLLSMDGLRADVKGRTRPLETNEATLQRLAGDGWSVCL